MTDPPTTRTGPVEAGERPRLVRVPAGPAGVRRSWAELISSLHGGVALLDASGRVEQVSAGFLTTTGLAGDDVVGRALTEVFPRLLADSTRTIGDRAALGALIGVGQQLRGADGVQRWVRVSVLAADRSGAEPRAVVFVQDTTATSHAMAMARQVAIRLTEVEEHELARLRRRIHDGPVQMLVALHWRLSMLGDVPIDALHERIGDLTGELQASIAELVPSHEQRAGTLLERWIAPFVANSPIELRIDDHLHEPPNRAVVQAAFIHLYELVRATRHIARDRTQTLSLDHEHGGYRLLFTTTTTGEATLRRPAATRFRAMGEFVRSIGGSIETGLTDDGVRTFSVWLPRLADITVDDDDTAAGRRAVGRHSAEWIRADGATVPAELGDRSWEQLMRDAPEAVFELDSEMNWLFANRAYERLEGATEQELVAGAPLTAHFTDDEVANVAEHLVRGLGGEPVEFEWARRNADGQQRFVRVIGTPRFSPSGVVEGALTVVEDETDLHFVRELQASTLADLGRLRRQARLESFARLRRPLAGLLELGDELACVERRAAQPEPIADIRRALATAIADISRIVDLLEAPAIDDPTCGRALGGRLTELFPGVEIAVGGDVDVDLGSDDTELLGHIAREAIANAVVHGRAGEITVTLRAGSDTIEMDVGDDGAGFDPTAAAHDRLGVRLMVERARARSGSCTIAAAPGHGAVVSVRLPRSLRPHDPRPDAVTLP